MRRLSMLALLLSSAAALAAADGDHATQWPLTLSRPDAGAYRLVLDARVYRALQSPALLDFEIVNREGAVLPTALLPPSLPPARPVPRQPVPWFAVVGPATAGNAGWGLHSEIDADGRLRRVEVRSGDASATAGPPTTLLVDLSALSAPVSALRMTWTPLQALDVGYRIDASDDLEHWRPLASNGRLIELHREGDQLLHRRIELAGPMTQGERGRYLRLSPDRADARLQIIGVEAEFAAPVPVAPQWLDLQPVRSGRDGGSWFEYRLPGRFPVHQVDVALPSNHATQWLLESRDDRNGNWQRRAGPWVAFRVDVAGQDRRSVTQPLPAPVRDRYWRLSSSAVVEGTPVLRMGYRPEAVVFLAQGAPPFRLVGGSVQAHRRHSPLPELVAALRGQEGRSWQPAAAFLGEPQLLAGDAALQPRRDWKTWLLWAVLAAGAAVVAAFAFTLLRQPRDRD